MLIGILHAGYSGVDDARGRNPEPPQYETALAPTSSDLELLKVYEPR
jgi:hypothetical protein